MAKLSDLESRMQDMETEAIDRTLPIMLFGPPGTGKTTLAMWIAYMIRPEGTKTIYLDSAQGWVSLDNLPSLKENATRIPFMEEADLYGIAEGIRRKSPKWRDVGAVVLDEASSMATTILEGYVRARTGARPEDKLPEIEGKDYAPLSAMFNSVITTIINSGVHIIIVAHTKKEKANANAVSVRPAFSPLALQAVSGLVHVVANCTQELLGDGTKTIVRRFVQAKSTTLVQAKNRIGALEDKLKFTHEEFVDVLAEWVAGNGTTLEIESQEVGDDLQPLEEFGAVPDAVEDDDDEPAFVGE